MTKENMKKFVILPILLLSIMCQQIPIHASGTACLNETLLEIYKEIKEIETQIDFIVESAYENRVQGKSIEREKDLIQIIPERIENIDKQINDYKVAQGLKPCESEAGTLISTAVTLLKYSYEKAQDYLDKDIPIEQYNTLKQYMSANILLRQLLIDFLAITEI